MSDKRYELIDSGEGRKLERWGSALISRPSAQAVWKRSLPEKEWDKANAIFSREEERRWQKKVEGSWECLVGPLKMKIELTDFGHLGVFAEQAPFWAWMEKKIRESKREIEVLNLFAYSGGSTMAAAKGGAKVCHLDASKGMIAWAKENAALNGLAKAPIRYIVDDALKFLAKEERRGRKYDAIILDPPSFGRGPQGQVFKIEEKISELLFACAKLLTDDPLFVLFSCHTPNFSPLAMEHIFHDHFPLKGGVFDFGEMAIEGNRALPSGTFARWQHV